MFCQASEEMDVWSIDDECSKLNKSVVPILFIIYIGFFDTRGKKIKKE